MQEDLHTVFIVGNCFLNDMCVAPITTRGFIQFSLARAFFLLSTAVHSMHRTAHIFCMFCCVWLVHLQCATSLQSWWVEWVCLKQTIALIVCLFRIVCRNTWEMHVSREKGKKNGGKCCKGRTNGEKNMNSKIIHSGGKKAVIFNILIWMPFFRHICSFVCSLFCVVLVDVTFSITCWWFTSYDDVIAASVNCLTNSAMNFATEKSCTRKSVSASLSSRKKVRRERDIIRERGRGCEKKALSIECSNVPSLFIH